MPKIKAVIDTNIFVRVLIGSAVNRKLYSAFVEGAFIPILSREMLAELAEVLSRPKLKIPPEETKNLLHTIKTKAAIIETAVQIKACRDQSDDIVLEAAVSANADMIVSSDKDLLALNPFRHIPIIDSCQFLKILKSR